MHKDVYMRLLGKQRGNALTEFVVLTIVMVPAALAIPMLGKVADVNQSTVQASRYGAWERTINNQSEKSDAELVTEIQNRFFAETRLQIETTNTLADSSNPFWVTETDPEGKAKGMITLGASAVSVTSNNSAVPGEAFAHTLSESIASAGNAMAKLVDDAEWGLEDKGFYVMEVTTELASGGMLQNGRDCNGEESENVFSCVSRRNAIFVDDWHSGSTNMTARRVRSLVPGGVFRPIGNAMSYAGEIPVFQDLSAMKDIFGDVRPDVIPLDRYGDK
jgi:hypothetical protein